MITKYRILDISKYNPISNYTAVALNIDGVIIRVGYRSYSKGILTKDNLFDKHIVNFSNIGTKLGAYFFTTAITPQEAIEEANYVVNLLRPYNLSLPIFADSEYSNKWANGRSDKLNKTVRTNCIMAFCNRVEELGYTAGVYASDSWFKTHLNYNEVRKYKIWVASYSRAPRFIPDEYAGWQYTSSGRLDGIPGRVDLSHWYDEFLNVDSGVKIETLSKNIIGLRVDLKVADLYKSSAATEPTRTVDGIYYIWSNKVYNNKIRITNDSKNVGNIEAITGWVKYQDVQEAVVDVLSSRFIDGAKVELVDVPLYSNSKPESKPKRKVTGTFYIWSNVDVLGKIRITNDPKNVGNINKVTGWVSWNSISSQF